MRRVVLCCLPLALLALAPAPLRADDRQQKEIDELRAQLNKAEDRLLEMARRFDQEKKQLQDEKEKLLKELAAKGGGGAPSGAAGKTLDWGLKGGAKGQTLGKLVALLKEHGLEVKLEGLTGEERIPLRLRGLSPRQLLETALLNLKGPKGDRSRGYVEVSAAEQDGVITVTAGAKKEKPGKTKKKKDDDDDEKMEGEKSKEKEKEKDDD
ncbi:MAG: hypothetical protein AB7N76_30895 [Planctomycetota bacterium]